VKTYIDAAYGVHTSNGKSHTGCAIVLGEGGPVYNKSTKQKIVTKYSTEAELVALSDSVSQSIHMRNFLIAQGYVMGPVIVYQDNMSCMALVKKGVRVPSAPDILTSAISGYAVKWTPVRLL